MHRITTPAAIVALALSGSRSLAQPADTLRGPEVSTETLERIGTTTMSGRFVPVEGRPELAAFAIVCDDPDDLARARELGTAWIFELTELLVDEIDTLREITDANAAGDTGYAQNLMGQIRLKHDPDTVRDPLREDLEALLDDGQRERFDRILDAYWMQWVSANTPENDQNMMGEPVDDAVYQRIENRLNNQLYQRDIGSAYQYSLQRYQGAMTAIYEAIEPTPEQRAWIQARVIQHIKDTRLSPTLEQREAMMLEIYDMLDEERKTKLFLYMARTAMQRG